MASKVTKLASTKNAKPAPAAKKTAIKSSTSAGATRRK